MRDAAWPAVADFLFATRQATRVLTLGFTDEEQRLSGPLVALVSYRCNALTGKQSLAPFLLA